MLTLQVTTANICGNPLRAKPFVRRRMRRALRLPGATFGQEVARSNRWKWSNYNYLWRVVAKNHGKVTFGGPREVPISFPTGWTVDGHESILVHTGRKLVSPNRYITTVKCTIDGHKVALVNCHPVSKPRTGVPFSTWRIAKWNAYAIRLAQVVTALHTEGYTVVFGGDMNKRTVPVVVAGEVTLIESGLDHLWCLPAQGVTVGVTGRARVGTTRFMDHPILSVTLEIA